MATAISCSMLHDASSSSHRCSYHAFLSFRGADTRKGFADHLYRALELAGIHTFRDDGEIERGANMISELQKAMQESKVSVIVFSKNYASSRWCLDELAKIMERRRADGHIVMPVFYDVDPSEVRWQSGSFAEAFSRHEEWFKEEMDKVEEWRKALKDVADLTGMVLKDRYESQCIQDIVKEIGNKLDPKALNVAPYAVGIDDRVRGINLWLEDGSNDVGVAVIHGMGGIGKTTLAKAAYNLNYGRFQGSSFLADIRTTSEQPYGFVRLQRKLLSDIQQGKAKKIRNINEGLMKIKHAVCNKRVLIVLDDVNDLEQFNSILGMREWFCPGSKIIITTRHEHLKADKDYAIFEVEELNEYESLELFSWHAFGQDHPIQGYMELSRAAVEHCGGLPLALQVLGSSLAGKEEDVWQSALQKLYNIPNDKVQKILRISFDSLEGERDKKLFLDIACFFIGKEKDFTITVLDNLDFYTRSGIQNLVDRCLVKVNNEDNRLSMHHLLRDMGRGIVRKESPQYPGNRSRVWHKDAFNILRKTTGTETVKGLMLNLPMLMEDDSCKTLFSGNNRKRCHVEDYDGNFSKRRLLNFFSSQSIATHFSSTNSAPASNEVDFKTEALTRMNNLELLLLNNVNIYGGFEDFPKSLTWLAWRGFPLKSIPVNFLLENLVVLDLRNSSLQHAWKGAKVLPSVKILNLSHSCGLMTTPDFSGLPNLERLILKNCINLVEVDDSIGDLEKLVLLNLRDCKNLMKLPTSISRLRSLQELILSGCSKLGLQENQEHSTATATEKFNLLSANLWKSIVSWVLPRKNLELTSFSFKSLPHSLQSLSLAHCNLAQIPSDLGILSSLKSLDISGNPIPSLPENMNGLIMLQNLLLEGCSSLQTLPELPPSLKTLEAGGCTSLKRITNLPNYFRSLQKNLWDCKKLVEVQSLFNIIPLRNIDIEIVEDMGLINLESTGSTEVEMINYLTNTTKKCPLQGLNECGIFSIFVHGSKIPDWFSYKSMGNSMLSIIVPSPLSLKIRGLNACVLYAQRPGRCTHVASEHFLKVSNETKGRMWTYSPVTMGVPKENEDMLWLSHWTFGEDELEGGEEIRVSMKSGLWMKEFGIQIVYEQENGEDVTIMQQETTPFWKKNAVGNVTVSSSQYEMWRGKYFLCNHRYRTHQAQFRRRQENPAYGDFSYKPGGSFHLNHFLFQHEVDIDEKNLQYFRKPLTN